MRKIIFVLLLIVLTACATYNPVVDPASVRNEDRDRYFRDRAECRALAEANTNTARSAGRDAVIGGAVGTGTGALLGTIFGSTTTGLAAGAVIGGVAGASRGVYQSNRDFENIFRNCMRGRGYRVLN
jgi:uncharacterized protein YcfJ